MDGLTRYGRRCLGRYLALVRPWATGGWEDRDPAASLDSWLADDGQPGDDPEGLTPPDLPGVEGLDLPERRIAALLASLSLDAPLAALLHHLHPGSTPALFPMEFVVQAVDPSGRDAGPLRGALTKAGRLAADGWIEFPDSSGTFLAAGHRLAALVRHARSGRDDLPPAKAGPPPWLVPMDAASGVKWHVLSNLACTGLDETVRWWRYRQRVFAAWGFRGIAGDPSGGIIAIFHGPPGTGCREAAAETARRCGVPLLRVEAGRMMSRWIGETELRLSRVFEHARHTGSGLLFEDAEHLFAGRTSVSSSNDRYANLTVDVFLSELDRSTGLVIITTGNLAAIDPAVARRAQVKVPFLLPDADRRAALWTRLAADSGMAGLDAATATRLGHDHAFSPGEIHAALVRAHVLAADRGQPAGPADVVEACRSIAEGRGDTVRERRANHG